MLFWTRSAGWVIIYDVMDICCFCRPNLHPSSSSDSTPFPFRELHSPVLSLRRAELHPHPRKPHDPDLANHSIFLLYL